MQDRTALLGEGEHTVEIRAFDTHYTVFVNGDPVPVLDFYDDAEYTANTVATTGETLTVAPETYARLLGDCNDDGTLSIVDVLLVLRYILNEETFPYADANGNGKCDLLDALQILRHIL